MQATTTSQVDLAHRVQLGVLCLFLPDESTNVVADHVDVSIK